MSFETRRYKLASYDDATAFMMVAVNACMSQPGPDGMYYADITQEGPFVEVTHTAEMLAHVDILAATMGGTIKMPPKK